MSERLCVSYPLIARFLTAQDVSSLILTNKVWNTTLKINLYELYFDGACHGHEFALQSFVSFFRCATIIHLSNINSLHSIDINQFSVVHLKRSSFILTRNEHLTPLSNLKHLTCGQCTETYTQNEALNHFVIQFPSLISLQLIDAYYLCDKDLEMILSSCKSLNSLSVTSAFYLIAPACSFGRNLTSLSLIKCPQCSFSSKEVSLIGESRCQSVPTRLTSLDLSFTALTSKSLSAIFACASQQLRSLTLVQCMNLVGNVTIESKSLTELSLRQCAAITTLSINCNTLETLGLCLCSRLRTLHLTSCSLPSLSLSMLHSLREIDLKCSSLKNLDLSGCSLLLRDSTNAVLYPEHIVSSQSDAWTHAGISPYLAQQIEIMQQNNPELDMSKLIAYHAGGTILFEQRIELLTVLAQIKLPKLTQQNSYRRRQISRAIGVRSATNRTKSL